MTLYCWREDLTIGLLCSIEQIMFVGKHAWEFISNLLIRGFECDKRWIHSHQNDWWGSKWDDKDFVLAKLNSKAISCMINGLTCIEFHNIISITCAKEMWNYREVTHKGTNEIKNYKINTLTQEFKSIRLISNELIDDFLNKFKSISNWCLTS